MCSTARFIGFARHFSLYLNVHPRHVTGFPVEKFSELYLQYVFKYKLFDSQPHLLQPQRQRQPQRQYYTKVAMTMTDTNPAAIIIDNNNNNNNNDNDSKGKVQLDSKTGDLDSEMLWSRNVSNEFPQRSISNFNASFKIAKEGIPLLYRYFTTYYLKEKFWKKNATTFEPFFHNTIDPNQKGAPIGGLGK